MLSFPHDPFSQLASIAYLSRFTRTLSDLSKLLTSSPADPRHIILTWKATFSINSIPRTSALRFAFPFAYRPLRGTGNAVAGQALHMAFHLGHRHSMSRDSHFLFPRRTFKPFTISQHTPRHAFLSLSNAHCQRTSSTHHIAAGSLAVYFPKLDEIGQGGKRSIMLLPLDQSAAICVFSGSRDVCDGFSINQVICSYLADLTA